MPFRIPMANDTEPSVLTIQYKGDCYVPYVSAFQRVKMSPTRFQPDPYECRRFGSAYRCQFFKYGIVATQESYPTGKAGASYYLTTLSKATYNVTLYPNGGAIAAGQDVTSYTYGSGATLPTDVTRSGYTFAGWYDNEALEGTPVTSISATDTGNKEYWDTRSRVINIGYRYGKQGILGEVDPGRAALCAACAGGPIPDYIHPK